MKPWAFQWKKWLRGGVFFFFFQFFFVVICWCSPRKHGGGGKKTHIFLKYCSKWSKLRWSNHCSYKGIVPAFRDLPRASESAEIWCKATRIRDFSRWKKPLGVLEIVYITLFQEKTGFSPCFYFKGSDSDLFLGFLMHIFTLFFFFEIHPHDPAGSSLWPLPTSL